MSRPVLVLASILLAMLAWWLFPRPRLETAAVDSNMSPPAIDAEEPVAIADLSPTDRASADNRSIVAPEHAPKVEPPPDPVRAQGRRGCGPGRICGVVLRGEERMPDALVELSCDELNAAGIWKMTTAESGEFAFPNLAPNHVYLLRVTSSDGTHRQASVELKETGVEQIVVFGSGCIAGQVLDEGSFVAAGVEMSVFGLGRDGGHITHSLGRADAGGRFEFCGLPAATYWVSVHFAPQETRQWKVSLGPGQRTELRLGTLPSDPRWIGQVVDATGRATPWVQLVLEELDTGLLWRVMLDPQGRFEQTLPSKRFRIGVVVPDIQLTERGVAAGELVMGEHDVLQNVVVPGARVDFRFLMNGQPTPSHVQEKLFIYLNEPSQLGKPRIQPRDGVGFVCLGLAPGRYELSFEGPYRFVEGDELHYAFDVPQGARTLEFDLAIRHWRD